MRTPLLLLVTLLVLSTLVPGQGRAENPAPAAAVVPFMASPAFYRPTALVPVPTSPGRAWLTTQSGRIWNVPMGTAGAPFLAGTLTHLLINPDPRNEEGLLGVAFSPGFEDDHFVYVTYTAGRPRRMVLSRFRVDGRFLDPRSEKQLLEIERPFANHNGGHLEFGPDGMLYLGVGDGGSFSDPGDRGQRLDDLLGSILRLDVSGDDYAVPPDNPFVQRSRVRREIYAFGFRNPWSFSFDDEGQLWVSDVGQTRWEEVNIVEPGGNYGWATMEGYSCFRDDECNSGTLELPVAVYGHDQGCAVIGAYVYTGRRLPALQGRYVFGDFCSGKIWHLAPDGGGAPELLVDSDAYITGFARRPDGEIFVLGLDGSIWQLTTAD